MFYEFLRPNLIWSGETMNSMRCRDVETQLAEYCLYASVSRHTVFGIKMYLLEFQKDYGGGKHPSKDNISEALDILIEWVDLYECEAVGKTVYAVKECNLNNKHMDENGRLVWHKSFDLQEILDSNLPVTLIKKQLGNCDTVIIKRDKGIILLNCRKSAETVAEKLGVSEESVTDISCETNGEITHIVIVEDE